MAQIVKCNIVAICSEDLATNILGSDSARSERRHLSRGRITLANTSNRNNQRLAQQQHSIPLLEAVFAQQYQALVMVRRCWIC